MTVWLQNALGLSPANLSLYLEVALHMGSALLAGGVIGLERSFHGRPAGFRTHTLVCLASSVLMLVTLYQSYWFARGSTGVVTMDPTRMAQGIMTGIGFLGAGVIFKEGLTVRGLTTAASIWITAAIGVLMGIGFYSAGVMATLAALGVLALFRRIELRMPTHLFAQHIVRFKRDEVLSEEHLRELLREHGFSIANLSYRLEDGDTFEYRMMLRTTAAANLAKLARSLSALPAVREFRLSPTGD
ncbi:MAG: MgtC/SapB family protein [Hydrogenophaga sp.]|uniref:MgtC/SapB family protein n=1 Tax=Hydrogenophaga sp. TaxID=1904254 RepID=UPI001DF71EDE|nr:MgtC/SapB family protein [Hydrogenophaga sp.]MBX3609629.1 MgtC/SapB family protein [Hydrogenophaga sp.]